MKDKNIQLIVINEGKMQTISASKQKIDFLMEARSKDKNRKRLSGVMCANLNGTQYLFTTDDVRIHAIKLPFNGALITGANYNVEKMTSGYILMQIGKAVSIKNVIPQHTSYIPIHKSRSIVAWLGKVGVMVNPKLISENCEFNRAWFGNAKQAIILESEFGFAVVMPLYDSLEDDDIVKDIDTSELGLPWSKPKTFDFAPDWNLNK